MDGGREILLFYDAVVSKKTHSGRRERGCVCVGAGVLAVLLRAAVHCTCFACSKSLVLIRSFAQVNRVRCEASGVMVPKVRGGRARPSFFSDHTQQSSRVQCDRRKRVACVCDAVAGRGRVAPAHTQKSRAAQPSFHTRALAAFAALLHFSLTY
jgi:hypothetical protein